MNCLGVFNELTNNEIQAIQGGGLVYDTGKFLGESYMYATYLTGHPVALGTTEGNIQMVIGATFVITK